MNRRRGGGPGKGRGQAEREEGGDWRRALQRGPVDDAQAPGADGPGRGGDGRGRGGDGRGPRDGQRPGQRPGGPAPERSARDDARRPAPEPKGPDLEYVLITPNECWAAGVYEGPLPLKWAPIDVIRLLKPGLYLRRAGSLSLVTRDLSFDRAVLYVVWEDPDQEYPVSRDRSVRLGLHAGFLVPCSAEGAPPWIPLQARIDAAPHELEHGLLSPWLDQVSAVRFRPRLEMRDGSLWVGSTGALEEEAGTEAVRETMRWLARNPEDTSPGAAAARRMLVDNGHGLQRLGLTLLHEDEAGKARHLDETLPALAPDVDAVLGTLWSIWSEESAADPAQRSAQFLELARLLSPALRPDAPLQRHANLAVLATWLSGLFGARPDRDNIQPARTLFAAIRLLRDIGRQVDLLDHPDVRVPTFPLDHAASSALNRALGDYPREETDLERMVRALAIAEAGWEIGRPTLQHLRPFRIAWNFVRSWPIAARTVGGRYDYILTTWSFRGAELREGGVSTETFAHALLLDGPSFASSRALARVAAGCPAVRDRLLDALAAHPHPATRLVADVVRSGPDEVAERYRVATIVRKITREKLLDAVVCAETLVTRGTIEPDSRPTLQPPERPDAQGSAVRGHFMYWRVWCRSLLWSANDVYGSFLAEQLPVAGGLPPKLETELYALLRQWLRHSEANRDTAAAWIPHLQARIDAAFDGAGAPGGVERLANLMNALVELDAERWRSAITARLADPALVHHLDRLLEGPRLAGRTRELARSPLMRPLHARLCAEPGPRAVRARVEWVRASLDEVRGSGSVRWLLDARGQYGFVGSPAFSTWFAERALAALDAPSDAIRELLELALATVADSQVDSVLHSIGERTLWPATELQRMLIDAGRWTAAADWMRAHGTGTEADLERVIGALIERARSGRTLLAAARAMHLAHHRFGRVSPALATAFERAWRAWSPNRRLPFAFGDGATALRLASRSLVGGRMCQAAAQAFEWALESGDPALLTFASAVVEDHVAAALSDALSTELAGTAAPGALAQALSTLELPPSLARLPSVAESRRASSRVPTRLAVQAVNGLRRAAVLENRIAAAVIAAWQADPTALERAGALAASLIDDASAESAAEESEAPSEAQAIHDADSPNEAPAPSEDAAMTVEGAPSEDAVTTVEASSSEDVATNVETTDGGTAGPSKALRSLRRRATNLVVERIGAVVRLLEAPDAAAAAPLLARFAAHHPAYWDVRRHVYGTVQAIASARDLRVDDPRRLLSSDFLEGAAIECDLLDVAVLTAALASVGDVHGLIPRFEATRRGLAVRYRARRGQAEGAEGEDAVALPSDAESAGTSAHEDSARGDANASDGSGDASDGSSDSDRGSDAPSGGADPGAEDASGASFDGSVGESTDIEGGTDDDDAASEGSGDGAGGAAPRRRALDRLMGSAARSDAPAAAEAAAWGSTALARVVRELVARNPGFQLRWSREQGTPVANLTWRGGR